MSRIVCLLYASCFLVFAAGCGDGGGAEPAEPASDAASEPVVEEAVMAGPTDGATFLAENGLREGVVSLPSGLQYEVMTEGDGATPGLTSTVTTHYHGTLIDGTVFDSSVQRGRPASFPVNGVISGWTEALQLMQVGDKWRLFVPPDLAYGERGAGGLIAPGTTLIFEVELLEVR